MNTEVALLAGWIALAVFDVLIYLLYSLIQLLLHIATTGDISHCPGKSGGNNGIGWSDGAWLRYTHLELLHEHVERAIRRIQTGLGDNRFTRRHCPIRTAHTRYLIGRQDEIQHLPGGVRGLAGRGDPPVPRSHAGFRTLAQVRCCQHEQVVSQCLAIIWIHPVADPTERGPTRGEIGIVGWPGIAVAPLEEALEPGHRSHRFGAVERPLCRLVSAAVNQIPAEGLNKGRETIGEPLAVTIAIIHL